MKVLKERTKSKELLILESLTTRMPLAKKDKQYYYKLKKGYEGEVLFDSLTEGLTSDCIILNDLLLNINNTLFQIDSLFITAKDIYLNEVKNFDGDYYFDSDRFFKKPHTEITNPLHQLSRCKHLLQQIFLQYGYHLPIHPFIIFIHPEFTLYQATMDLPIIHPTQIKRYLNQIEQNPLKLVNSHKYLAEKLLSLHIKDSPFSQIPTFSYEQLRRGINCYRCQSLSILLKKNAVICTECKHEDFFKSAVIRMVEEFKILFPDKKIRTNTIHDWCNNIASKRMIRNVLENNYKRLGENRWTYYE